MSNSRPTLLQVLHSHFILKKGLYDRCRNNSIEQINHEDLVNFFADYPPLLCEEDLSALQNRYVDILRNITPDKVDADGKLTDSTLIAKVNAYITDIASKGAGELIDSKGRINQSFIIYLKLQDHAGAFVGREADLVHSYVSFAHLDVHNSAAKYNHHYAGATNILFNHISRNKAAITHIGMQHPNRNINLRDYLADAKMVLNFPSEQPKEAAAIAAIGGATIGAIGLGILLFSAVKGGGASIPGELTKVYRR